MSFSSAGFPSSLSGLPTSNCSSRPPHGADNLNEAVAESRAGIPRPAAGPAAAVNAVAQIPLDYTQQIAAQRLSTSLSTLNSHTTKNLSQINQYCDQLNQDFKVGLDKSLNLDDLPDAKKKLGLANDAKTLEIVGDKAIARVKYKQGNTSRLFVFHFTLSNAQQLEDPKDLEPKINEKVKDRIDMIFAVADKLNISNEPYHFDFHSDGISFFKEDNSEEANAKRKAGKQVKPEFVKHVSYKEAGQLALKWKSDKAEIPEKLRTLVQTATETTTRIFSNMEQYGWSGAKLAQEQETDLASKKSEWAAATQRAQKVLTTFERSPKAENIKNVQASLKTLGNELEQCKRRLDTDAVKGDPFTSYLKAEFKALRNSKPASEYECKETEASDMAKKARDLNVRIATHQRDCLKSQAKEELDDAIALVEALRDQATLAKKAPRILSKLQSLSAPNAGNVGDEVNQFNRNLTAIRTCKSELEETLSLLKRADRNLVLAQATPKRIKAENENKLAQLNDRIAHFNVEFRAMGFNKKLLIQPVTQLGLKKTGIQGYSAGFQTLGHQNIDRALTGFNAGIRQKIEEFRDASDRNSGADFRAARDEHLKLANPIIEKLEGIQKQLKSGKEPSVEVRLDLLKRYKKGLDELNDIPTLDKLKAELEQAAAPAAAAAVPSSAASSSSAAVDKEESKGGG